MALTYGFYNSVEGDRTYDAIQMGQIFDGIITDGVYATFLKAMVVKASDNPSEVIVQPGRCWFNHTWTYIDADYPVTAPAPEVILDRVDALVIDINTENAFRANSLVWVQGTPSSLNPERPTLIKSVTHNQYPLCYVYRKAGTTMIYAADITNAVGTSETPFVTGVLQGINIDDLLAQWDDEFHTWETATKTSFEAWMVNQQSVYVTWFDSIKDQMEDDLTGFEAWFETIRGIIDEEAATHLQAEIDDILDMLPAGSHIDISTNEPTLFNRNVTVSDGVHSKTVQFNAIGGATVESFPYIGIIDVSSTDGERIASESLNIPYFGRYSVALAFWSATVNLVGDETLAGLAVTVRDGNGDVVAVVTLNGSGQGVFTATKPDEYTFTLTYGGQTMEVSLAVTQETTYEVELHGGFRFDQWLLAGRVEEEFDTLDEILADEPTLRQLFLVHDSVDYICDTFSESATSALADITKIFNTDLAAKWINLSDYALDHFYAVSGIKSIMDTADKYGYGEWALMPQVPKMTSDTAPYGTAFADGTTSSHEAYRAFDEDSSTYWTSGSVAGILGYHFASPVCIKKFVLSTEAGRVKTFTLQGSNDGTNYTTLGSFEHPNSGDAQTYNVNNSNTYSYYRIQVSDLWISGNVRVFTLQFYAWAPKGNVPVMTSNSAPYGTASASSVYSTDTPAWKAFDKSTSTYWVGNAKNSSVQYKFTNPVCVRRVRIRNAATSTRPFTAIVKGSNNGTTWETLTESFAVPESPNFVDVNIENSSYFLYLMVDTTGTNGNNAALITILQFYGRELKVSVPKMTSNTAPYGTVTYGQNMSTDEAAYKAFDKDTSTRALCIDTNTYATVGYRFTNPVPIEKAYVYMTSESLSYGIKYGLQYSDDGVTYTDCSEEVSFVSSNGLWIVSTEHNAHLYWNLKRTSTTALRGVCFELQFYGLDYSEKEFEAGATKKWLYDHGVELEEFYQMDTAGAFQKLSDEFVMSIQNNSQAKSILLAKNISDLTPYSLMRAKCGDVLSRSSSDDHYGEIATYSVNNPTNTNTRTSRASMLDVSMPNNHGLSISSLTTGQYPAIDVFETSRAVTISIKEWWLE